MKPQPGCRILDIGCGPGTVAPYFHDVEYVGFDSSPEYIESARRQFPRLTFVCARVSEYQPQREYFDVALALGVVHHLDDDEALQLFQMVQAALRYISHFMATTYPIMWLKRRATAWAHRTHSPAQARDPFLAELRPVPILNGMLRWLAEREANLIAAGRVLPFGTSLLAVATRPEE